MKDLSQKLCWKSGTVERVKEAPKPVHDAPPVQRPAHDARPADALPAPKKSHVFQAETVTQQIDKANAELRRLKLLQMMQWERQKLADLLARKNGSSFSPSHVG